MDLSRYVEEVRGQLAATADAGDDEVRDLVERLLVALDPAIRLALLDALGEAAAEITRELAPGSVDLRLRGRDPSFVVTPPPTDLPPSAGADDGAGGTDEIDATGPTDRDRVPAAPADTDDDEQARLNVRLPGHLKVRIERAAAREGLSANAWLVRTAAAALDGGDPSAARGRRAPRGGQSYTGWVR